jgi:cytochrome c biogenesis protein CcmG/thiol:disulfide interchange protein DsbE
VLSNRAGKPHTLVAAEGITLINFFASWCTPCIEDHRQITALMADHPNLTVHGIAWRDAVATNDLWLKTHGNPFTRVWYDTQGKAAIALGLRGIPETYVIDSAGIIRAHIKSAITEDLRRNTLSPLLTGLEGG